jgi:hypothetical protein
MPNKPSKKAIVPDKPEGASVVNDQPKWKKVKAVASNAPALVVPEPAESSTSTEKPNLGKDKAKVSCNGASRAAGAGCYK